MACRISDFMRPEWIIPSLKATTKEGVLKEIAQHLQVHGACADAVGLFDRLLEREQKASTGADHGLAIPHATLDSSKALIVAFARSTEGIDFGAIDQQRSHLFFTVINPAQTRPGEVTYLQAISSICRLMRSGGVRAKLLSAASADELFQILSLETPPKF